MFTENITEYNVKAQISLIAYISWHILYFRSEYRDASFIALKHNPLKNHESNIMIKEQFFHVKLLCQTFKTMFRKNA